MRNIVGIIVLLCVVAAIVGWLSAGGDSTSAHQKDAGWRSPSWPQVGNEERDMLYAALLSTGHFGMPSDASDGNASDDTDAANSDIPPQIAATALTDGVISVIIHGQEGKTITARVGEQLPNDWTIQEATLDQVIISKEGQTLTLTVFPHGEIDS